MYDLDVDESQGGIAINLLPLLAQDISSKGDQSGQNKKAQRSVKMQFNIQVPGDYHVHATLY